MSDQLPETTPALTTGTALVAIPQPPSPWWGELNEREVKFVLEYVVDYNGTQAAIRAGIPVAGAAVTAHRMLRNAKIARAIRAVKEKFATEFFFDKMDLLHELLDVYHKCREGEPNMVFDPAAGCMVHDGTFNFDSKGAIGSLTTIAKLQGHFPDTKAEREDEKNRRGDGVVFNVFGPTMINANDSSTPQHQLSPSGAGRGAILDE